jgi:protein-S-isoprenylcysteine O-methyltransferase Ste14
LLLPIDRWRTSGTWFGLPVLGCGIFVLLWCVRDFYIIGKGTLAPWDPPKRLVVVGLYRIVRNPMYVGVLGVVLGWSLVAGSPLLAIYAAVLAIGFHLRVVLYEEPVLRRQFGDDWTRYRAAINRWLPK